MVSLEGLIASRASGRTRIAITFDDGYASCYGQAVPVLEELRIPAAFFVCSGFIDSKDEDAERFCHEGFKRRQKFHSLGKQQLRELAGHPLFEVGSHSMNHIDLGKVNDKRILDREIEGDRTQIEDWTGKKVQWFAYPFGGRSNVSAEVIEYLRRTQFRAAFSLVPGFVDFNKGKFMMRRDSMDMREPDWLWRAWLNGGYDSLFALKENLRRKRRL